MNKRGIAKNIMLSVIAQGVSFTVSLLLNLVVPKFIDEYSYADWQTYVLYVSYVGILHFGLLDGIVLRYSQYDYDELNKEVIRSQFKFLLTITSFIMIIILVLTNIFFTNNTKIIFVFVSIGIVIKNIYTYSSYTFQITNRIDKYVFLVIVDRLFYGAIVVALLLMKIHDFYFYCVADLCSDVLGIAISSIYNRGLYFGHSIRLKETVREAITNISSGIMLLVANWSAVFLVGSAKMIVQWKWNNLVFGKVSFSFSITNLFLTIVSAVSVVLFPSIKRVDEKELPSIYNMIRSAVMPLLLTVMILYYPGCKLLRVLLPKYSISLKYLGILLPIIVFSSVVSLLTNNYFKAYREEKAMLVINVVSVVVGVITFGICAYIINNLNALLISIVAVTAFRSIWSEIYISKIINKAFSKNIVIEIFICICFIASTFIAKPLLGFSVYAIVLFLYFAYHRDFINSLLKKILRR